MRVFIDGAAGTTGIEIRERLADRPEFELIVLDDDRRKDADARIAAAADADIAVLCLPDEAARAMADALADTDTRLIDASSAHRTADGWTYGFAELGADMPARIAAARCVSNPGCYPTGFLALVRPLVAAGIVPADWPLTVHAVSGYSGGGKALVDRFAVEADLGYRAYGFGLDHKHLPEMRIHAGLAHAPVFSPGVARAYRGMIVEVPLHLAALPGRPGRDDVLGAWTDVYHGAGLVVVDPAVPGELLMREGDAPTDGVVLRVATDAAGTQARLVAVLDNLGKGASGAAVQNLNLMAGLDPLAGLHPPRSMPHAA